MVGDITWARGSYMSVRGKIVSDWRIEDGSFYLNVIIPANSTATVYLPAGNVKSVTEGGRPADTSDGVRFVRMEERAAVYRVDSGNYLFASKGFKNSTDQ